MSHTSFKAHTTSKGIFIFFQHYASYVDLEHGKQPKTEKRQIVDGWNGPSLSPFPSHKSYSDLY